MGLLCHAQFMWCWRPNPGFHDCQTSRVSTELNHYSTHQLLIFVLLVFDPYEYLKSETIFCKALALSYWNLVTTSLEFQFLAAEREFLYRHVLGMSGFYMIKNCLKHSDRPLIIKKFGSGSWLLSLRCSHSLFCLSGLLRLAWKMPSPYFTYHHNREPPVLRLK